MTLEQGLPVRVYSRVLREEVIWVPNSEVAARVNGVTYTLKELEALKSCTPEQLRLVHEAKKIFGGRLENMREEGT